MLEVKSLGKSYGAKKVLNNISFHLSSGSSLAIVGESGSGKSTLASCIIGMTAIDQGTIHWTKAQKPKIQMIFQDPASSLNPKHRLGFCLREALRVQKLPKDEIEQRIQTLLPALGFGLQTLEFYPHELSGGQKQRMAMARALLQKPDLLIADEPTSALDQSIQAQIINLLRQLQSNLGFSLIFITHDLHLVPHLADQLMVLRAGEVMDYGSCSYVIHENPCDYTRALWKASQFGE